MFVRNGAFTSTDLKNIVFFITPERVVLNNLSGSDRYGELDKKGLCRISPIRNISGICRKRRPLENFTETMVFDSFVQTDGFRVFVPNAAF